METLLKQFKQQQHYQEPSLSSGELFLPHTHTQQPTVTGSSILGIKCIDGVVVASDTLASYGSLARYPNIQRVFKVNNDTVVAGSGDYADFQDICDTLEDLSEHEYCMDDNNTKSPSEIHQYLTRILYEKRNKMDPLWNSLIVAGFRNNESFLGYVDLIGTNYLSDAIGTGYGAYIGLPILRKFLDQNDGKITVEQGKLVLVEAMRTLFYRDARTIDKIQLTTVTKDGVDIGQPFVFDSRWNYKGFNIRNDV